MNRQAIPLGRVLGIPIGLDYSWFLIFALLTWTLAANYYPAEFQTWPAAQYWIVGALTATLMFGSVLLHELGHSVVALRYNIPVRSITLFIFGGVAQIGAEPPSAGAEFWIAIAGPLVSFTLALFFRSVEPLAGAFAPLLALVKYLAYINGVLAFFNLVPGFPLDGGRVFRAVVWGVTHNLRRATLIAGNVGRVVAFIFIIIGVWYILNEDFGNGLWLTFIGWFLESAASAQVRDQTVHDLLADRKVSEVMSRSYTDIPAEATLQHLVDEHILGAGRRCFMVTRSGEPVGLLTVHGIKEVPQAEWPVTTVGQVMIPMSKVKRVQPDAELWSALEEMDRDGVNQLPVMVEGCCYGMLSREDVISYMRTRRELGV